MYFWYGSGFGSPVARVQGIGYVQELVARLTHTPIATHNSSTNATLADDERTFPLDHVLYVDATHEVVVLNGTWTRSDGRA
jgi:3D (Asp-Asp-Asp) domain-containing protein